MGSKPRRYPVDRAPVPEKHEVTKTEILEALADYAGSVISRPELCVFLARKQGVPHGRYSVPLSWARTVIAVPAAERLLDKMVKDGLVISRGGGEWVTLGVPGLPSNGVYYTTPEKADVLDRRAEGKRVMRRREAAAEKATTALIAENYERYKALIDQYYTETEG